MATTPEWHSQITAQLGGAARYGKGIMPNPFAHREAEWARRKEWAGLRHKLAFKIESIFEPRFITTPPTVELLEALITMTDARQVLELGMCTGFGSMHMLRALVGKPGAKLTSIDFRPAHDREFFESPDIAPWFEFVNGETPESLKQLHGRIFNLVFIDSDHSVEHTQREIDGLKPITQSGTLYAFHDCPAWQSPSHHAPPPVRLYLESLIQSGEFSGMMLPSPRQLDCQEEWGPDYDTRLSPGLAVLIRK